jgi:L-rhamnose isomerase
MRVSGGRKKMTLAQALALPDAQLRELWDDANYEDRMALLFEMALRSRPRPKTNRGEPR